MNPLSLLRHWRPILAAGCAAVSPLITVAQSPNSAREDRPDPREIPIPPIATELGTLPGVDALPVRPDLPDVLTMNDGTPVKTLEQWSQRRQEMRRVLEYYAVGQRPPPPGNVKGREVSSEIVADGTVRYRLIHLTFGPGEKLSLDLGVFTPVEGGPFPAIIAPGGSPPGATPLPRLPPGPNQGRGENVLLLVGPAPAAVASEGVGKGEARPPGASNGPAGVEGRSGGPSGPALSAGGNPHAVSAPVPAPATAGSSASAVPGQESGARPVATADAIASRHADVFRRGYALVLFNANDCAEDTTLRLADGRWAFRTTRFYPAYPGYDWGILAGWAWGASRIADYLETDPAIDRTRLIITGASRLGKSAMVAAAFDERLMGAPVVTGGGGVGAYRFAGPRGSETLDVMQKKYPNWFSPHLHEFWGQREKLPFDQHWFLALCAPRPFLALEGDADTISLPEAVRQSMLAARPAYALFGATDKLGVNYAHHGHAFTAEDWTALLDFADRHLRGKTIARTFGLFPSEEELDRAVAEARAAAKH